MQRMADILCEYPGPVRLITINRPDQMNSLDFDASAELVEVWRAFAGALRLESRSLHDLGHTGDFAEGTASFREKRTPRFSGH
jgi:enoyl-CoA hydratase/carnithine racemase